VSVVETYVLPKNDRPTQSDALERYGGVESSEVSGIAGQNAVTVGPCDQHDRCVDDVRSSRGAAKLSGRASEGVIQRDDLDFPRPQEPSEQRLPAAVSPYLTQNTSRDPDRTAVGMRQLQ
jgi:hypothetical protein